VLIASLFTLLTGSWISLLVIALTNGILMVLRFIIERLIVPLAKAVLAVILYFLQLFYEPEKWAQIEKPKIELFNYFEEAKPVQLADPTAEGLKAAQPYMLGILLSVVAVIILVMLLRLPRGEQLGDADGVGEKTGGNALKQLRKAISRGLKNTMDRFAKRVNLRRVTGMFRAARIRWIYQQFELLAARKGYPRQAAVTPREFQSCVTQYFNGGEVDIDLLTAAYQSVRYGELPETAGEVTRVVKAWEHLKNIKVVRQAHPKQRQKR
jgi:preprotein translocase subunit SecG